jgi:threonine 3-dehydrogenase
MRAIMKKSREPGLAMGEVPRPEIAPNEVLVKVRLAGICGTDVHIHKWDDWAQGRIHPPLVLGHEFVGEVVESGRLAGGFKPGTLVTAEGHIGCGICTLCRTGHSHVCRDTRILGVDTDGAFAEFVRVPATNVWPIEPGIPIEWAAIMDPLGNAFHAVLTADVAGKSVLVTGCGPIGLFSIGIARAAGAARVFASEVDPRRREMARREGADRVIDPRTEDFEQIIRDETRGDGVHVVLEMSGNAEAIGQGLQVVRNSGRVQWFGIPGDPILLDIAQSVIFKGLTIYGVTGRLMYETWYEMRNFLISGRYDPSGVITHRVPFARFEEAFAAAAAGHSGKVILDVSGNNGSGPGGGPDGSLPGDDRPGEYR